MYVELKVNEGSAMKKINFYCLFCYQLLYTILLSILLERNQEIDDNLEIIVSNYGFNHYRQAVCEFAAN